MIADCSCFQNLEHSIEKFDFKCSIIPNNKITKITLQIFAFVYNKIMNFSKDFLNFLVKISLAKDFYQRQCQKFLFTISMLQGKLTLTSMNFITDESKEINKKQPAF